MCPEKLTEPATSVRLCRMASNNPAGRLHDLLKRAKALPDNSPTLDAWGKLLFEKGDNKTTSAVLARIGMVIQLPAETLKALEGVPGIDAALHLGWVSVVENAFCRMRLDATINHLTHNVDDATLVKLHAADHALSQYSPEPSLTPDHLTRLNTKIDDLREEIETGDGLPHEVRTFLLEQLLGIQVAVDTYRIRGARGLRDAVNRALGALTTEEQATRRPRTLTWARILVFCGRLASLMRFGADTMKVEEGFERLMAPDVQEVGEPRVLEDRSIEGEIIDDPNRRA